MPSPTQSSQSQGPSSPAPVSPESIHPSCSKGKKRHWSEPDAGNHHQVSSPKLENSAKPQKREHGIKLEDVPSLIETKGGLDSLSMVEQLVYHMRQVQNDYMKSPDKIGQLVKVAGVISATEQGTCLNHFIRIGGLSSLDEWLQYACKGKVGESDSVTEGFIIALLNALETLSIDKEALKACSILISVKRLYNHKNPEIQRKAKNLVKRVGIEMKALDETKGENNPVQVHVGESGLLKEGTNLKHIKPSGSAVGGNCGKVPDDEKGSGTEVQKNRGSVGLDVLPPEEGKDGAISISPQESLGAKEVGLANLNEVVREECVSKPSHVESLSNKSCLAEEASLHSGEDLAQTGIQSSLEMREKDTKPGVGESTESMTFDDGIARGSSDVQGEWMSVAHISNVDGHISKESQLGVVASSAPLHGEETSTWSPTTDRKEPVNDDSGSPNGTTREVEVDEKDKRAEPCQKKGFRLADSGSISTSIMSSINSSFSDHQPSIKALKVVADSTYRKGLIEQTSKCGGAEDCDMRNGNFVREASGASYSAGSQEDTGTSDGDRTFRKNSDGGLRLSDESNSRINIEDTSTRPDEKKYEDAERDEEMDLQFVVDDALEVARQVGKEAEQEVESYSEPLCSSSSEKHAKGEPVPSTTTESVGGEQGELVEQNVTDNSYCSKQVDLEAQSGKDDDNLQGKCASEEISGNKTKVMQELESCKITIISQESIIHHMQVKTTNFSDQMHMLTKCKFDLNEDITAEEGDYSQELNHAPTVATTSASNCTITNVSTPIPVVAASKGPLNLPTSPLHFKGELGWRGSAATSAFRPAEPRRTPERDRTQSAEENNSPHKPGRRILEIDLNVADDDGDAAMDLFSGGHGGERYVPASASLPSGDSSVEVSSSRRAERLTLDLNRLCENDDTGPGLLYEWRGADRLGASLQKPNRSPSPTSSSRPSMRDFDLNDNPSLDDACASAHDSEQRKYSMKSNNGPSGLDDPVVSILGSRINPDLIKLHPPHASGFVAPWDITHNSRKEFPNSAESFLVSAPSTVSSLNNMGRMLSMPSAVTYPTPPLPFPYTLGTNFPITSTVYGPGTGPVSYMVESMGTPIPQIVAPATFSSSFTRPPYLMGVTSGVGTSNANGIIRPNLDLNSGASPTEVEGAREAGGKMRQFFPQGNNILEDQMRPFQQIASSGPPLKRKEPECGWESYQLGIKQATAWR